MLGFSHWGDDHKRSVLLKFSLEASEACSIEAEHNALLALYEDAKNSGNHKGLMAFVELHKKWKPEDLAKSLKGVDAEELRRLKNDALFKAPFDALRSMEALGLVPR